MALISHRHSMLLHGFQQSWLGLRRRTVYLIRQHQIGKNRSLFKPENTSPLFLHHNIRSCHITGHQIRCKLNPFKRKQKYLSNGTNQHGFSKPRHTFQQNISTWQQCQHHLTDDISLPDNALSDFLFTLLNLLLIQFYIRHLILPLTGSDFQNNLEWPIPYRLDIGCWQSLRKHFPYIVQSRSCNPHVLPPTQVHSAAENIPSPGCHSCLLSM